MEIDELYAEFLPLQKQILKEDSAAEPMGAWSKWSDEHPGLVQDLKQTWTNWFQQTNALPFPNDRQ